ncbi:MAG TPA: UTP--glucose-1-phosphate uridylyltransferase [Clostridia bacterium]|nr:UTP--glucose-1-phosphate uridylyltransferase [Clostridia bacterium]
MAKPITKAVVLAAGFGTRFLPASKAVAKVMFPVIDKPIIQLVVEELVKAGINDIHFVLSPFTQDIKEHFQPFPALNELLAKSGKEDQIEELRKIENMANFSFGLQQEGRHGIGKAILSAREVVGEAPFVLLFADEFYWADPPWITQLIEAYNQYPGLILGCIRTSKPEDGARYGFVTGEKISDTITKVDGLVEKPGVGKAPSDLASMSGMVFVPEIFKYFEKRDKELPPETELYHTYGIKDLIDDQFPVYALEYQNYRYFDTGDKLGYLKALVELGLESKEIGKEFKEYLQKLKL